MKLPKIGDTMYYVCEHRYYDGVHAAPCMEYCVCTGTVKKINECKATREYVLVGNNPDGYRTLHYFKPDRIGKSTFFWEIDAANEAKRRSDKYERTLSAMGDPPIRRPWESVIEKYNQMLKGDF